MSLSPHRLAPLYFVPALQMAATGKRIPMILGISDKDYTTRWIKYLLITHALGISIRYLQIIRMDSYAQVKKNPLNMRGVIL